MILNITETSQTVYKSSLLGGWVIKKEWHEFICQSEAETVRGRLKQPSLRGEVTQGGFSAMLVSGL